MSADARDLSAWQELRASGRLGSFVLLCLGVWLHAADSFLAATTMPPAVAEIGGLAFISWTLALYQLAGIVAGAGVAVAARRFGMRRVLVAGAASYALGCAASAIAPDMAVMLAGRLVQGAGGGAMIALTYVATQRLFPERLWTRLMAIVSAIWGASSLVGPLIGGAFADAGLWRGAFWAFAAQAAALAGAAAVALRGLPPGDVAGSASGRWPWHPLGVLSAGVLLIAFSGAASNVAAAAALGLGGCALLVAAARIDALGPVRLMPTALLRPRGRAGAGLLMALLLAAGATAFSAYGPLLTETLFGISTLKAGALLAAESVTWTVATLGFAGADPRWDRTLIRAGATAITAGGAGLAAFTPGGPLGLVLASLMVQGAGFGICWPFVVRRIVQLAPAGERDISASATSTLQRIGYAVGASAAGVVANASGIGAAPEADVAWWVMASSVPVLLAGCVGAWRFTRPT
jgi:MFS family permease